MITRRHVAIHEAGHAVMAWNCGRRIDRAAIDEQATGVRYGSILYTEDRSPAESWATGDRWIITRRTRRWLERSAMIRLAGHVATKIDDHHRYGVPLRLDAHLGEYIDAGAGLDMASATNTISYIDRHIGLDDRLADIERRTAETLQHPIIWRAVRNIATALLVRESLTAAEVRRAIHSAIRRPLSCHY